MIASSFLSVSSHIIKYKKNSKISETVIPNKESIKNYFDYKFDMNIIIFSCIVPKQRLKI